jgi:hypothetical protein
MERNETRVLLQYNFFFVSQTAVRYLDENKFYIVSCKFRDVEAPELLHSAYILKLAWTQ